MKASQGAQCSLQSLIMVKEELISRYSFVRLRAQNYSIVFQPHVLLYYSIPVIRRGSRRLTLVVRTSKFLLLSGLVV